MSKCIEHTQKGTVAGYGNLGLHGKKARAHRVAYCKHHNLTLNDIHGKVIRHTCDNPRCINPEHLLVGTHQDNSDDKLRRDRHRKGTGVHTAILTERDVLCIREQYVPHSRKYGTRALARYYGVTHSTISCIVTGRSWAHLGGIR